MTQATAKKAVVDPGIYSRDYFLADNEGWREYEGGLDACVHPKFARALEIARPAAKDTVLDIGCGRGELLYYCAKMGAEALGLDYSAAAVEIARQTIRRLPPELQGRARAEIGDPCTYEFGKKFSIVFMIDTLEHMHDWQLEEAFGRINSMLSGGGRLIIITPNHYYEEFLSPLKRLADLPLNLLKIPLRLARGRYKAADAWPLFLKAFRIRQDRGELNRAMHVNVATPAKVRRLLAAFDAKVTCEDPSTNVLSLLARRWWGRNIVAVARKR
jgi:2-polyprenyl-3-methyl-5-hydroxy-6-metoxy-1,4-benzoquinol methylase